MKNIIDKINLLFQFSLALILGAFLTSCEDVIQVDVQKSNNTQVVVDGFIGNQPNTAQVIKVSLTQSYFDNATVKPALGASVTVTDESGTIYTFKDLKNDGNYTWTPAQNQGFGSIGKQYNLSVKYENEEYISTSKMNRVPKIDSIVYEYKNRKGQAQQGVEGLDKGYQPEFYARDPTGVDDCYWIRGARNNKFYTAAADFVIAYDASFDKGANIDGLIFIQPLRRAVFRQLCADKDTVTAEVHSINYDAFRFFQALQDQSQNAGIFATPTANLSTNIANKNAGSAKTALGFFSVSAVSSFTTIIDKNKARPSTD